MLAPANRTGQIARQLPKSSPEARGPYRKTAHPKTTRKVGVAKAHSSGRKTASKVAAEKARGTYRKTAARFEEFPYDGQMPESMRDLGEKSVAQTREFYVHPLEALLESSGEISRRGWSGHRSAQP